MENRGFKLEGNTKELVVGMACLHFPASKCMELSEKAEVDSDNTLKLTEIRKSTTIQSFIEFTKLNVFSFPFTQFCFDIIKEDLSTDEKLLSLLSKIIEKEINPHNF